MSYVVSAPLFVAAVSFVVARVDWFQVGVLAPEDFSVSNLLLWGFTAGRWIQRSCVCFSVLFASEIAWNSPIVNTVSQTMYEQVSSSWIRWSLMANCFQSNVICCLETKNASWRQTTVWRYSAHHWIDERCEFSSLGTMRGPRTEGDAIINSLRSALCAVINLAFASGHFARNYSIHSRGLSWTHHNGSLPFIWVTTVLKRRIKLISQRRLNQKGDKGVRGWVSLHSERNCDTALNSFLWRGRWRGKIWNIKLTAHADPNIFKPGM